MAEGDCGATDHFMGLVDAEPDVRSNGGADTSAGPYEGRGTRLPGHAIRPASFARRVLHLLPEPRYPAYVVLVIEVALSS